MPLFAIALELVGGRHSLAGIIDIPLMKERYVAIRAGAQRSTVTRSECGLPRDCVMRSSPSVITQ